jgi:hypothetical protein
MTPQDAINRLREHSGLSVTAPQLTNSSLIDRLQAIQRGGQNIALGESVTDVIECLECVNQLNQSASASRDQTISGEIVYAISGMVTLALEVSIELQRIGKDCNNVLHAIWKISCAWDAVLAGDIEDIHTHLYHEGKAKNIL